MKSVIEMLENSAAKYPEKYAFGDENSDITFSELCSKARSVGTYIASLTAQCSAVPCYLEKSTTAICGMMGAVYAGCFYSILDIHQPHSRILSILNTLEPEIILTDRVNYDSAQLLDYNARIICIEDIIDTPADEELLSSIQNAAIDIDPLYVNFTSGSTGVPKGVTVCHRSVIDFIGCFTELFSITSDDIIGNQAPFDFDVSVKDIYSGLLTGAKVQIIPRSYFSIPTKLMDYLCENSVTVLIWAVSAMCFVSIMNGFSYRVPSTVKRVMFSGEVLPIKHYNVWKKYLPNAAFVNLYGPTEITCNCTYYIINREFELTEAIPIGKPFPNERVFLLDDDDRIVRKVGVVGEICVSGTAVALGYYASAERTAQAFQQNPINNRYLETIYRTGDIGRYDENGDLVYVSRKDFQIKHLGHRIELGEIETAATACNGITRACCVYDSEKKRIRMFYTGELEKNELMPLLKAGLPQFMLPNSLVKLDEMPITKNGKIDRNKLNSL